MSIFDFFKKESGRSTASNEASTHVNTEPQDIDTETNEAGNGHVGTPSAESQISNPEESSFGPRDEKTSASFTGNGKAQIYNLIIIDESGSMRGLSRETVSGVNETIGTIRQAQEEFGDKQDHFLTLVTFDSPGRNNIPVRTLIDNKPIAQVEDFSNYQPGGCTPLYDAMGQSITRLYNLIKNNPDASAVVTILTDGMENASLEYNGRQLKELIEGLKKEGWTFSYMGSAHDVKSVTDLLSIDNFMEFSHDCKGARNTWEYERSSKIRYFRNLEKAWESMKCQPTSMKKHYFENLAHQYSGGRVTPTEYDQIPNEAEDIFIFGSSLDGAHDGGTARYAVEHFGAVIGQGNGLQGHSYAIPTLVPFKDVKRYVEEFINFAEANPELKFHVTPVGCGAAGYSPAQIAPLFEDCIHLENVSLPLVFWKYLGISMMEDI